MARDVGFEPTDFSFLLKETSTKEILLLFLFKFMLFVPLCLCCVFFRFKYFYIIQQYWFSVLNTLS